MDHPTGHRYHSHPYDYRPDDELPPDKTTAQRGLPKDLAARLERLERAGARGETVPPPECARREIVTAQDTVGAPPP